VETIPHLSLLRSQRIGLINFNWTWSSLRIFHAAGMEESQFAQEVQCAILEKKKNTLSELILRLAETACCVEVFFSSRPLFPGTSVPWHLQAC
jgi:hypothetical protein